MTNNFIPVNITNRGFYKAQVKYHNYNKREVEYQTSGPLGGVHEDLMWQERPIYFKALFNKTWKFIKINATPEGTKSIHIELHGSEFNTSYSIRYDKV